jgi:phosphorylase kinase alpha/beta subunit
LAAIAERNPDLQIEEYIVLDVLIGHAVRLSWLDRNSNLSEHYEEYKGVAWRSFYESSPHDCANYIAKALRFLMELGQVSEDLIPSSQ